MVLFAAGIDVYQVKGPPLHKAKQFFPFSEADGQEDSEERSMGYLQ